MNIFNEAGHTALIAEIVGLYIFRVTFISKLNIYTGIEERLFTKSCGKSFIVVYVCFGKYKGIGFECNCSACLRGFADFLEFGNGITSFKTLFVNIRTVTYFYLSPFGKGIYDRCTDTVKTA